MDKRHAVATGIASTQFGAVSTKQLARIDVDAHVRRRWLELGLIQRLGPKSFAVTGSPPTWRRNAWAAMTDVDGCGYVAGRTAARLLGLDGFDAADEDRIEILVKRSHRNLKSPHLICSTSLPLGLGDSQTVDGIRCLTTERLILDAPLFAFTRTEVENAIDSAIRLKLVSEQRLRSHVVACHRRSINNGRALLDALVDAGGESRLERWFLELLRRADLPRPHLQKVWREGSRTVARVDAAFDGGLIVELAGHGTHSSRQQSQRDEQRRTELTLRGLRVITFTYNDVRDRPDWVLERLREAFALLAA